MDDVLSTASSDSDFMSPFAPFRETQVTNRSEQLPVNHDNSWIGARLSPIAFDDEDDDKIAPYKQALIFNDSMLNERSALLPYIKPNDRSKIHPMWDEESPLLQQSMYAENQRTGAYWGTIVWFLSGIHLLAMGIHDGYLAYISYRQGLDIDVERWSLPWLSPSRIVLQRFGAFLPYKVLVDNQWWRMVTSIFLPTSAAEWLLVYCSWRTLRMGGARPTKVWALLFLLSVFTGQIWMMAFDQYAIGGGAAWGSSGVMCAAGGAKPQQRFLLFMMAIGMVILSLLEPNNSVIGAVGGSFFGWSYYGLGWSRVVSRQDKDTVKPKGFVRLLSGLALLKLWVIPMLFVAFKDPAAQIDYYWGQ